MPEDQTLTCRDCNDSFIWTAGEQEFYQTHGLTNPPGRCSSCRANRKASSQSSSSDRQDRTFFEVPCSQCGNIARVPFQPRGTRPVYCSACFQSQH